MNFELSPLITWIAILKVNTYSEFQVNICRNNIDVKKCQSFYMSKKKKNAFRVVSLDGIDCSLDSEHMFRVSSKSLQ